MEPYDPNDDVPPNDPQPDEPPPVPVEVDDDGFTYPPIETPNGGDAPWPSADPNYPAGNALVDGLPLVADPADFFTVSEKGWLEPADDPATDHLGAVPMADLDPDDLIPPDDLGVIRHELFLAPTEPVDDADREEMIARALGRV